MYNIYLNNESFPIRNFNRNTYFGMENGSINSNGYVNFAEGADMGALHELAQSPIQSLTIKNENLDVIYNTTDTTITITSIDENLGEGMMNFSASLKFDYNN